MTGSIEITGSASTTIHYIHNLLPVPVDESLLRSGNLLFDGYGQVPERRSTSPVTAM
jgi:hypothetical protein